MDDFEQAIHVVFNQSSSIAPAVREQATGYLDNIKRQPDGWQFCWEQFVQRNSLEARFWCMQVILQTIPSQSPADRFVLRSKFIAWLGEAFPARQDEFVVKNQIALVYVRLLKWSYPDQWPTAWKDILGLLEKGPSLVDMFLRILDSFDQEVVSDEVSRLPEERQRSHHIKHAMREGDVQLLAECWFRILGTFRQTAPQLVIDCLKAISLYIVWIDIHAIANDQFLSALCNLIGEAGPLAMEACKCLAAVLQKKMPAEKKIQMFVQLQILQRLEGCVHRSSSDLQLLEREAELFNAVADAALEIYVDLRAQPHASGAAPAQASWELLNALMPSVLWFFSHSEYQVAQPVEPFLTQFFVKVKAFVSGSDPDSGLGNQGPCHIVALDQMKPILVQALQLIIQRIAYPEWYQHGDPTYEDDERHIAFLEFRRSLTKIYKRIFLIDEHMGFQFINASLSQLTQNLPSVRPMEVDAVLYLYKETGEIVKDVQQHLSSNGPLASCFLQLLDCQGLVQSNHWIIQLSLIELYVRYGRIFSIHVELFSKYGQRVLEAFVGTQGIAASDARVVARACAMLPRFVKLAKKQIVPFAVQIYDALKSLMEVTYIPSSLLPIQPDGSLPTLVIKGKLKIDDQASLHDAIASLVAAMAPDQMFPALQILLKGPVGNLTEIIGAPPPKVAADVQGHMIWAARSIEAVATISKPFSAQHACTAPHWEESLAAAARTLEKFAGQFTRVDGLWRSTLFLCRRMVEVLGDAFLGPLDVMLPLLYNISDQTDLAELTVFAHQCVCQYMRKAQPLLQKWIHIIFLRPYDVWKELPEDSEQFKREKLELGCAILILVKEMAQRCPVTLLESVLLQRESRHGQELVSFLMLGVTNPSELRALFLATSTWSALLESVISSQETQPALASLPLVQLLRHLLASVVRMDFQDAQSQKVLGEAASILRSVTSSRLLPQGLQQQGMGSVQQALVEALPGLKTDTTPRRLCECLSQDTSLKDIRTVLQHCVADWRRDCCT